MSCTLWPHPNRASPFQADRPIWDGLYPHFRSSPTICLIWLCVRTSLEVRTGPLEIWTRSKSWFWMKPGIYIYDYILYICGFNQDFWIISRYNHKKWWCINDIIGIKWYLTRQYPRTLGRVYLKAWGIPRAGRICGQQVISPALSGWWF